MHSCLQTMLQVVGFSAKEELSLEVRQVACEHEIQELNNRLQFLQGKYRNITCKQQQQY